MITYEEYSARFDELMSAHQTPVQDKAEFWNLLSMVQDLNPKNILEIGSEKGGTAYFWNRVCGTEESPGKLVCVDAANNFRMELGLPNCEFVFLEGNSHSPEIYSAVMAQFPNGVDFLFLDGDHWYDGVKEDFEKFSPLVAAGGIIAFHDIHGDGVQIFWPEIKAKYSRTQEFSYTIGIGVIHV